MATKRIVTIKDTDGKDKVVKIKGKVIEIDLTDNVITAVEKAKLAKMPADTNKAINDMEARVDAVTGKPHTIYASSLINLWAQILSESGSVVPGTFEPTIAAWAKWLTDNVGFARLRDDNFHRLTSPEAANMFRVLDAMRGEIPSDIILNFPIHPLDATGAPITGTTDTISVVIEKGDFTSHAGIAGPTTWQDLLRVAIDFQNYGAINTKAVMTTHLATHGKVFILSLQEATKLGAEVKFGDGQTVNRQPRALKQAEIDAIAAPEKLKFADGQGVNAQSEPVSDAMFNDLARLHGYNEETVKVVTETETQVVTTQRSYYIHSLNNTTLNVGLAGYKAKRITAGSMFHEANADNVAWGWYTHGNKITYQAYNKTQNHVITVNEVTNTAALTNVNGGSDYIKGFSLGFTVEYEKEITVPKTMLDKKVLVRP